MSRPWPGLPGDLKRRLEAELPAYGRIPATVTLIPRDERERPCAAGQADHLEVHACYATPGHGALDVLEAALKTVPGVYATTQVRRAAVRPAAPVVFTNPDWPPGLGTERPGRHELRPQVLALIRDDSPQAVFSAGTTARSIFRCGECGHGDRLRGWVHVNAHGPVGPDGVIEHYDYWSEDADEIIEESVTCRIHGEGSIEKLTGGRYTSAMEHGRFVIADDREEARHAEN